MGAQRGRKGPAEGRSGSALRRTPQSGGGNGLSPLLLPSGTGGYIGPPKVRDSERDFLSRLDFSSPDVMREGYLTAATVDRLQEWLPALCAVPDPARVTPGELFSMITVETLCILVGRKLAAGS